MKCRIFEIDRVMIENEINKTINTLAHKSMFKTKQDLFKVITTRQPFEPYEYVPELLNPN